MQQTAGPYVVLLFITYFISERERERRGAKREGILSSLHTQRGARMWGSIPQPWDHDLSRNQESDAQPTEPPRRPVLFSFLPSFK